MKLWKLGWILVVTSVALAGCGTGDNEDTGTDAGTSADAGTGSNSDAGTLKCTADADCGSGRTCDTATGQCKDKVGERSLSCTDNSGCLASELCHPTSKVCVQTCVSSAECPDSAKSCAVVSATDSRKVCQCSTGALCNVGRATEDLVCSHLDKVCTPACTSDAACGSGRTCDTATGQCKVPVVERSLSCADNAGCLASEICHPTAKVCVQTCTGSFDCPDSAKTCEAVSSTNSQKVCKCSTTQLCNIERDTADLVCSSVDRVCAPRCTSDAQCGTGKICDTAAGECKAKETDTTGLACSGEGQSICNYGTYCNSVCSPLPAPTCQNYENFTNKSSLGTTGPILFRARLLSTAMNTGYCPPEVPTHVRIVLSAYNSVPFPTTRDALNGLFRVSVSGTAMDVRELMRPGDYVVSGTNPERADITVNLCAVAGSGTMSTAFYFTNGNFLCYQATW
jgi:hypothetical protein